jgi:radical SAM superfamily enzyme YgiQ (UPF0313 family)
MRILFVYPCMPRSLALGDMPPYGPLFLASFVQQEGHEVRIYERNIEKTPLVRVMDEFRPDVIVGTLLFGGQIPDMQAVCKQLRSRYPGLPILCGGLTASMIPELLLQEGLADYVGISEGEYTLLELLEVVRGQRDPSTVQSLVYLDSSGKAVHTPLRPFADLTKFPETDYSLLPMDQYATFFPEVPRVSVVHSSKGCPFQCTFCFSPGYYRCQYRTRRRQTVMREIETLVTDFGMDGVVFNDELLGFHKEELHAYCDDISALSKQLGKAIRWGGETRFGMLKYEDFKHMADTGCWLLAFGLESGSPDMLKRLKKTYPLDKVETDINNCKAVGIRTMTNAIFGFPDETPAQVKQTVHTIFRLNPTIYSTGLYIVLPGTAEYDSLVCAGRIEPLRDLQDWSSTKVEERKFMVQNLSSIPDRELKVIHYFFYWRVVFQNRKDAKTGRLDYIKIGLQRVFGGIGRKGFFAFFATHFRLLLCAVWYVYAFPGIRKKYDLYARNFGRKDWDDLGHLDGSK